jgi:hypothetical protein
MTKAQILAEAISGMDYYENQHGVGDDVFYKLLKNKNETELIEHLDFYAWQALEINLSKVTLKKVLKFLTTEAEDGFKQHFDKLEAFKKLK